MSKRTDLLYFGRMLDEARLVERFTSESATEAEFVSHRGEPYATAYCLGVIARMAQHVSPQGKSAHPEIDWPEIVDLHEKIKRDAFHIDASQTWRAATVDVPPLLTALSRFMPSEPPQNRSKAAPGEPAISIPHEKVAEFCRKWHIKRLAFFGSFIRDDFDPKRSDVDVLAEFEDEKTPGLASFWDIPNELAEILGVREVDLVTFKGLDRWIRNEVLAEAVDEYVAA
jgi:predicted nucleotidyltransferase/uncharacterized protein with HEPN domain